jgi:hypothetical protein
MNHPWPAKDTKPHIEDKIFPIDDYDSDPWESQEEEEPEKQQHGQFIPYPEPTSE